MAKYIGMRLEISTKCNKCRHPLPINGVTKKLVCIYCQTELNIPRDFWQFEIGNYIPGVVNFNDSDSWDVDEAMYGHEIKIKYKRQRPRCIHNNCRTPFPDKEIKKAAESEDLTALRCSKCGLMTDVQKPPAWFKKYVHSSIVLLVTEINNIKKSNVNETNEIIKFHCYHCGASLAVDGTSRKITCSYCKNTFMIPDSIWLKLHPVTVIKPWYIVLNLKNFAGITPAVTWRFDDIAFGPEKNIVLLYHSNKKSLVSLANRNGMLLWIQDKLDFNKGSRLYTSPCDGSLLVVDLDRAWKINANTGEIIQSLNFSKVWSRDPKRHSHFAIDFDGTYIFRRYWTKGIECSTATMLYRYSPDGKRLPLWPGFFTRISFSLRKRREYGQFDYATIFTIGWNGNLYILQKKSSYLHITWYDRKGKLTGKIKTDAQIVKQVYDFCVNADGIIYILFKHNKKTNLDEYDYLIRENPTHLVRIHPKGNFEVWMGFFAAKLKVPLNLEDKISIEKDGSILLSSGPGSIRIIGPDGKNIWKSPSLISQDKEIEKILKKADIW